MTTCDLCKNVASRIQLKIKCNECSGHLHANCVDMSKTDHDFYQLWKTKRGVAHPVLKGVDKA